MSVIIDRRLNPPGKSLGNRQRFFKRARSFIEKSIKEATSNQKITDILSGGKVKIPMHGIKEPTFSLDKSGKHFERVFPGNDQYAVGDIIDIQKNPGKGKGKGAGGQSGPDEDEFSFVLERDELLALFLDDLELPDLTRKDAMDTESEGIHRIGYSSSGSPSNLSIPRTATIALARRVALGRPKLEEIEELEAKIALEENEEEKKKLQEELEALLARTRTIPWIDPIDTRYRQFEEFQRPRTQAVMICMMDVSGSMGENQKDLAKRFFMLLYIFLKRQYQHVRVEFIRHTEKAAVVSEEEFFHSRETGGTIVSSAIIEARRLVKDVYSPRAWNIYCAQASDGDNWSHDNPELESQLNYLLPECQYYAYIEVEEHRQHRYAYMSALASGDISKSDIWMLYEKMNASRERIAMRRISRRDEIFPVFQDLFKKKAKTK